MDAVPWKGALPAAMDLARAESFRLGPLLVEPSLRSVSAAGGRQKLEPRTMRVLVALGRAEGAVLSRDHLIDVCWDGLIVSDNAINRIISQLRRVLGQLGGGQVRLETITKVGFRLVIGDQPGPAVEEERGDHPAPRELVTRRQLVAGGAVCLAGIAGVAGWGSLTERRDPRVGDLLERGRTALREGLPDSNQQGIGFFEEALRLAPDDAAVWGLLAIARRNAAEYAPPEDVAGEVARAEAAARQALSLDRSQAEALVALAILPPFFGDWTAADRRLGALHDRLPDQLDLIGELGLLAFSTGRVSDAAAYSQRAVELDPLSPIYNYRRAYHLWSLEQLGEADRTIDRTLQLWPLHPAVWYARMLIFAGSDRPRQALAMLDSRAAGSMLNPLASDLWRSTCRALISGSRGDFETAVGAGTAAAGATGGGCVNAMLALSRLGALDEVFAIAEAYLLRRGKLAPEIGKFERAMVNDQRWRKTMVLFVAATAPMRADPRFEPLVADLGLAQYWRSVKRSPDFRMAKQA